MVHLWKKTVYKIFGPESLQNQRKHKLHFEFLFEEYLEILIFDIGWRILSSYQVVYLFGSRFIYRSL